MEAFDSFVQMLEAQWNARKDALRAIDEKRLAEPDWYRSNKLLGMMMYPANLYPPRRKRRRRPQKGRPIPAAKSP